MRSGTGVGSLARVGSHVDLKVFQARERFAAAGMLDNKEIPLVYKTDIV